MVDLLLGIKLNISCCFPLSCPLSSLFINACGIDMLGVNNYKWYIGELAATDISSCY
ncbi:hypothetical protein Syun_027943 [Stephania yunnanensis]|uniref:Uncharacterized protein n=1 Tax=Stephania yunnanensis TaxID=152371 RepID=A0AAP0ELM9_9MAGN